MSKYSPLIGSFQRTNRNPIEADYIFNSVEELNQWAEDPINYSTLHIGLQKVVVENGVQTLYWVVKEDETFVFVPYTGTHEGETKPFVHTNIENTEFKPEDQVLMITLKQGEVEWNEFIPLTNVINYVKEQFADTVSHDSIIEELNSDITEMKGQIAALLAAGGGGGGGTVITSIKVITFKFANSNSSTYIVDPNKLTEEEQANGISIPLEWEYNVNFASTDRQYIVVGGNKLTVPKGSDTTFTVTGIKESTTIQLQAINKTYGLDATSSVLKVTFGVTVYIGASGAPEININSFGTQVITPSTDVNGNPYLSVPFQTQTTDDFRYFAIPDTMFEVADPHQLVVRDENGFVIQGYTISTQTSTDGTTYYVFKLDNILHGSFTLQISK